MTKFILCIFLIKRSDIIPVILQPHRLCLVLCDLETSTIKHPTRLELSCHKKEDRYCTYKYNIEVCSHNHCCNGRAMSIIYSECCTGLCGSLVWVQVIHHHNNNILFNKPIWNTYNINTLFTSSCSCLNTHVLCTLPVLQIRTYTLPEFCGIVAAARL